VVIHALKDKIFGSYLTQEKNIVLNTKADSMILGKHMRSNNSIFLYTILLTFKFDLQQVHESKDNISSNVGDQETNM
jgi:hypothetical protein